MRMLRRHNFKSYKQFSQPETETASKAYKCLSSLRAMDGETITKPQEVLRAKCLIKVISRGDVDLSIHIAVADFLGVIDLSLVRRPAAALQSRSASEAL